MVIVVGLLSLLIGGVLGALGGGGAILMLPMLVYVAKVEPKAAIATSLFVIGATSVMGTGIHARTGKVRWKTGLVFALGATVTAFAGGRVAAFVPSSVLLVVFGIVMVAASVAMFRRPLPSPSSSSSRPRNALTFGPAVALGAAVGLLSGLVGAGGGFLIVPALTLVGGLAMREAIATSLLVIALQSFAGFAGHATHVALDWSTVLVATGAALTGSVFGARFASRLSPEMLRRAFAVLVLAMGIFVIVKR